MTFKMKEVYWHLPGLCSFFPVNSTLARLMKEEPYRFREGYRIGSVYGTFPGAIWNGGRAVFGIASKRDIIGITRIYNSNNVPVRFTWTNPLIEEKHIYDTYCNLIMELADNGKNQVLVNSQVLENYLREKYPNYKYISSTTKRITDLNGIRAELDKGFFMVVLDYDLNHDEEVLKTLEPYADRIEILVDEICFPKCPKRKDHYQDEGHAQLTFDRDEVFRCPNRNTMPVFKESMSRPSFIGNDDIGSYIDRGYVNFKLVGRGLPVTLLIDSYVYYLAREDEQKYVRDKLVASLKHR